MSKTKHYLIVIGLLVVAILFYIRGFATGALSLLILGGLFELGFWIGLFETYDDDSG